MLSHLAKVHFAICGLGHPGGFLVTVFDSDEVSISNIGRQCYSPSDVGINKAVLSVHRLNQFFQLDWKSRPEHFNENTRFDSVPDIIVSCVDTRAGRRSIHKFCENNRSVKYWQDAGNLLSSGQVILGQPKHYNDTRKDRLPTVTELYPDILDKNIKEGDDLPSCSLAEALSRQDLFIGSSISLAAGDLLWKLFRQGGIDNHGAYVNLTSGTTNPLPVDPETWKRIMPVKEKKSRKKAVNG
jgi:PRTRC genetic system ThiF family protein